MSLKAVLFDFNGVIINDEPLHEKLIEQLLIEENLRIKPGEYRELCLGRSDRACLSDLLTRRGRVVSEDYITTLIARKSRAYQQELAALETLPTYPGLSELITQLQAAQLLLGVVSGAVRSEIEYVLHQLELADCFTVIVAGNEITSSKPEPDGYLLAVDRLNQQDPGLQLQPNECLAIEDTFAGIEAAQQAGMPVVGVANTYPFHMMQRCANWAVDYLSDLELDRVQAIFANQQPKV
jgi:beta-phosphoglucomutase